MTDPGQDRMPDRDWTSLWENAASAVVKRVDERAYTGPVWEIASPGPATPYRAWKMAVLERKPGGGAEHWGHVLIILGATPSEAEIQSERKIPGSPGPSEVETLPGAPGAVWQVRIRPRSRETAPRLRAFALEFQRQSALLMGGDVVQELGP